MRRGVRVGGGWAITHIGSTGKLASHLARDGFVPKQRWWERCLAVRAAQRRGGVRRRPCMVGLARTGWPSVVPSHWVLRLGAQTTLGASSPASRPYCVIDIWSTRCHHVVARNVVDVHHGGASRPLRPRTTAAVPVARVV